MSSRRTSSVPKDVFPRMLYCDSRCSQTLTGLSPALPGALLCNAIRRLGDGQRVILRQRVRGSVRAVRAVRNTRVFQTETGVVADELCTRFHCHHCLEWACQMLAASRMELDMVLDSRRGRVFSLGLRLGFVGGGRLRY